MVDMGPKVPGDSARAGFKWSTFTLQGSSGERQNPLSEQSFIRRQGEKQKIAWPGLLERHVRRRESGEEKEKEEEEGGERGVCDSLLKDFPAHVGLLSYTTHEQIA